MSPQRFQNIREKLGFSTTQLATHLRLPNPAISGRTAVKRYERGHQSNGIPGPVSVAMEALEAGFRIKCDLCGKTAKETTVARCKASECPFQRKAL